MVGTPSLAAVLEHPPREEVQVWVPSSDHSVLPALVPFELGTPRALLQGSHCCDLLSSEAQPQPRCWCFTNNLYCPDMNLTDPVRTTGSCIQLPLSITI